MIVDAKRCVVKSKAAITLEPENVDPINDEQTCLTVVYSYT